MTPTTSTSTTVVVMAKAPQAGRSKTRLCPPCRPEQAADLAEAALRDTLDTVLAVPVARRVVALDGAVGPWLPAGFDVIDQVAGDLGARLAAAVEQVGGPVVVIGMDTPQLTAGVRAGVAAQIRPGRAVIGAAPDGGWWALGLHDGDGAVFRGVPMSQGDTFDRQVEQLGRCGLEVDRAGDLRDVDHWPDALAAASTSPGSRFAAAVATVEASLTGASR